MIGQTLNDRYYITALLGEGAVGEVYQATDTQAQREVALKIITQRISAERDVLERFRREGEALRKLHHANIVAFVEMFPLGKQYAIVMEYMPGGSLHALIQRGPLSLDRAVRIALELSDALVRAHHIEIIHRDVKPANVLLAEDGTPKLSDFGAARLVSDATRLTGSGAQIGTPYYMSPEAWEGYPLDAQADVWSLGVVLYEMLAGEVPFGGSTVVAVMNKVLTASLPDIRTVRPEVPPRLAAVVEKMLRRSKAERYRTMRQVAVELEAAEEEIRPARVEETRRGAEAEAKRQQAEEARREAEEEARRKQAEEARREAEEEARRKQAEEARRDAEAEARRQQEEEARREAEEEARRQQEEGAQREAEAEARRQQEEEARREAEEEARRQQEEAQETREGLTQGGTDNAVGAPVTAPEVKPAGPKAGVKAFPRQPGASLGLSMLMVVGLLAMGGLGLWAAGKFLAPTAMPASAGPTDAAWLGGKGILRQITYAPDGKTLAAASSLGIALYAAERVAEVRFIETHGWIESVVFSPDGKTLASGGGDNTVRLWDPATGQLLRTLEGHTGAVHSVAFSPDGKTLASGSWDKTVRLWDPATGQLVRTLEGHTDWVYSAAFSPDGKTLASGSWDATVRLWDPVAGRLLRTLEGHTRAVHSVAFSPDGKTLASGSCDAAVRLWDPAVGQLVRTLKGHTDCVYSVAFSPDGRTLASGSWDETVRLWDLAAGKLLFTVGGHTSEVKSVAFSPDGKTLASALYDGTVRLWAVER